MLRQAATMAIHADLRESRREDKSGIEIHFGWCNHLDAIACRRVMGAIRRFLYHQHLW
jgi:hypothetical protein